MKLIKNNIEMPIDEKTYEFVKALSKIAIAKDWKFKTEYTHCSNCGRYISNELANLPEVERLCKFCKRKIITHHFD